MLAQPAPRGDGGAPPPSPRRLVARFVTRARRAHIAQAEARGRLHEIAGEELLAPERLPALATASLWLLLASGAGFVALEIAARSIQGTGPLLGGGAPLGRAMLLVLANAASYAVMVPAHEAVHAAVMLALGGRPRFGLKLPLAAYCTAPGQLFTRAGYAAIALAPLLVLTAAGAAVTWLAPDVGACLLFGLAGNVSGAVGDLAAVARLRRLPSDSLIEDTQTGFRAFVVGDERGEIAATRVEI
jgi:hypothetical protein